MEPEMKELIQKLNRHAAQLCYEAVYGGGTFLINDFAVCEATVAKINKILSEVPG